MRWPVRFLAFAAICGMITIAAPAAAQQNPQALKPVLLSLIGDAQKGVCGKALAPMVADSCRKQIGYLQGQLGKMGRPLDAAYQGPDSQGAVFQVRFERGAMTWVIAQNGAGQVTVFWTP